MSRWILIKYNNGLNYIIRCWIAVRMHTRALDPIQKIEDDQSLVPGRKSTESKRLALALDRFIQYDRNFPDGVCTAFGVYQEL